jgi:signal transduction histidine kinase
MPVARGGDGVFVHRADDEKDMIVRPDWRPWPSQLDLSAAAATSSMSVSAETLVSHLAILRAERVGPLTHEQLRFLDTAERQGMRLLRMIQDLRTVALAERDSLELDWTTCDLADIAGLATESVAAVALARRKPIELHADGAARVLGDEDRLVQALVGMLDHAVEEGEATMPVSLTVRGSEVEVRYVAEDVATDSLGLALADTVASLHGGALTRREYDEHVSLVLSLGGESESGRLEPRRDDAQITH